MEIILIGNYPPDNQQSMERFASMLQSGFLDSGYHASIWRPIVLFGSMFSSTNTGTGKWMGYMDKWIVFPLILLFCKKKTVRNKKISFHICDHSNAPYLQFLPSDRTSITCHDVLAIRGAMGYADAYCKTSSTGKIYQKWILNHLSKAKKLAAVSQLTLTQLIAIQKNPDLSKKNWKVIYNAFNADFKPMDKKDAFPLIQKYGIKPPYSFILHVGSDQSRKNRKMLLDLAHELGKNWEGQICYAGQLPDQDLLNHSVALGLSDRLIAVPNPDHFTLMALYSTCKAFIFPSFSEGFGWPLIEAQACGAPVIASKYHPMPEISGGAALHADPTQPKEFAHAFRKLADQNFNDSLVQQGMINTRRFNKAEMIQNYLFLIGNKMGDLKTQ
ncbi:glycosyltransferase family 4 protein [Cyclobacterium jeungdonense]|uniref:Glycosyltransferase family 1 protein n=1 Tax=Cyclobacterium jeungdonense TaxID=708087 RepID=A0ABT8C9Q1_9BACT|nr:glycosyltransferase family 1 protein [Cyclobacterium jeungdonense]MDN3688867.1 glycosyltransferase family 1 protein [Cyclobacterium jeungdonense]